MFAAFFLTLTVTWKSLLFATTIENCAAAASLLMPNVVDASLSRSTAQKSQPTLDGLSSAASHGVLHWPPEQTLSMGHDSTYVPSVPWPLQRWMSLPVGPAQ